MTTNEDPSKFYEFTEVEKDVFRAHVYATGNQSSAKAAYGGLIESQALAAAEQTVSSDFKPHSLHIYFILNVDTAQPVDYRVRRVRDGRSFCTRVVEAVQNGAVASVLQASFHVVEPDSCVHQSPFPVVEKLPEDCQEHHVPGHDKMPWIFDFRCTDEAAFGGLKDGMPEKLLTWMRIRHPINENDERLHRWLLLFMSDSGPGGSSVSPHMGKGFRMSQFFVLDQMTYFHRHKVRADEWMLYELEPHYAGAGRGSTRGRLWSRDGELLASVTQECMVRSKGVSRL